MNPRITDAFLASGRFALSSVLMSINGFLNNYHDHSETSATKIPAANVPSGLLTRHLPDGAIRSKHLAPTKTSDTETVNTLAIAGGLGTQIEDADLTTTVNFSIATQILAVYAAQFHAVSGTGGSRPLRVFFKVADVQAPSSLLLGEQQSGSSPSFVGFTFMDKLLVPSGSQTIKLFYEITAAGQPVDIVFPAPRRLDLIAFSQ